MIERNSKCEDGQISEKPNLTKMSSGVFSSQFFK